MCRIHPVGSGHSTDDVHATSGRWVVAGGMVLFAALNNDDDEYDDGDFCGRGKTVTRGRDSIHENLAVVANGLKSVELFPNQMG